MLAVTHTEIPHKASAIFRMDTTRVIGTATAIGFNMSTYGMPFAQCMLNATPQVSGCHVSKPIITSGSWLKLKPMSKSLLPAKCLTCCYAF